MTLPASYIHFCAAATFYEVCRQHENDDGMKTIPIHVKQSVAIMELLLSFC